MAETVQRAVLPETRALRHFRSRTGLSRTGRVLRVRIVASDLGALRAAANSFLQFVLVARDAVEAVSKAQASKL
jgi:tRNA threonylcarbamoyladenosine modification (KEOPS) complex  Pcc1 subunit